LCQSRSGVGRCGQGAAPLLRRIGKQTFVVSLQQQKLAAAFLLIMAWVL
jgi:hypothetical protein